MFVLGVTGPSGAGKSTVCQILERYGFFHIDTDRLVPAVYPAALPKLTETFGAQVAENGTVNRKELAKAAFASAEATEKLNAIMHPMIMNEVSRLIENAAKDGYRRVTVDGAGLHEAHAEKICNKMICILAPKNERKDRILNRDNISEQAAELRMNAQKDDSYYSANTDAVLVNLSVAHIEEKLKQLIKEWDL